MEKVILQRENIYTGSLVLVNRAYRWAAGSGEDLEPVQSGECDILMQRMAVKLLTRLMGKINGWQRIVPVSGWRSGKEQREIWDHSLAESGREFTEKYVAYPGHSEHQTGLAIDLGLKQENIDFIRPDFPYEGICQTFRQKAVQYGFVERYPSGKEEITGIGHEPWHFRYVGIPHAMIMEQENLALEEYISFVKKYPHGQKVYSFNKNGMRAFISYLEAEQGQTTVLEMEEDYPYTVSGNNVDGFILTQYGTMRTILD